MLLVGCLNNLNDQTDSLKNKEALNRVSDHVITALWGPVPSATV